MLSQQAKDEFRQIIKEEYGKDITDAEAEEMGSRLIRLFELLLKVDQKQMRK